MRSLCSHSDCPPLQTILCQRKCIGPRHAGVWRDVIKPGGSRTSSPLEHLQEGSGGYPSPEAQPIARAWKKSNSRNSERLFLRNLWGPKLTRSNGIKCDTKSEEKVRWQVLFMADRECQIHPSVGRLWAAGAPMKTGRKIREFEFSPGKF